MRKTWLMAILIAMVVLTAFVKGERDIERPHFIPPSEQRSGDAAAGYKYLITGDFVKSGLPYDFFLYAAGKGRNYLQRDGKNADVDHGYNVITNSEGLDVVVPTCLQCHASVF
jgi:hypothetical protein